MERVQYEGHFLPPSMRVEGAAAPLTPGVGVPEQIKIVSFEEEGVVSHMIKGASPHFPPCT